MYTNTLFLTALLSVICSTGGNETVSLVAAWTKRVTKVSLEGGTTTTIVPVTHHSVALDVNLHTRQIFWSDGILQQIFKASLDDAESTKEVIVDNINTVDGLAVDWMSNVLYWTDTGKDTIEVKELNNNWQAVIVHENLTEPRAIVLHPNKRIMFWTDWGLGPKIERAGLDGSRRQAIITSNLGWPNGLTLDFDEEKLYWIDGKMENIESCNYDGTQRKIIIGSLNQGFGISSFRSHLYYSDWFSRTIKRINKNDGSELLTVQTARNFLGEKPMALQVLAIERQPNFEAKSVGCSLNPCSQLCLSNELSYTCFCNLGFTLQSDGHTCKDNGFLLSAWRKQIIALNMGESITTSVLHKESSSIVALDFLYSKGEIFWSNIDAETISQGELKNMTNKKVVVSDVTTVDGIAVDWVCNNLYWTDTGRNTIEVQSLDTGARKVLYSDDLDEPRAIVVYPPDAMMFFTDWGVTPKIESASLDGSERQTLITQDLKWPNGLAIDWKSKRLYWIDGSLPTISSCNFDGTDKSTVIHINIFQQAFGITMNEYYIFYSEWKTDAIYKINRQRLNTIEKIASGVLDPMGIKIYNSSSQPMSVNPCAKSHCSHICLPTRTGGSICACPEKLILSDKNKCVKEDTPVIKGSTIQNFKFNNIGTTSVEMSWDGSSQTVSYYFIQFKCIKMARCLSSCNDNTDHDYITTEATYTAKSLTSGVIYNVSIFNFHRFLYTVNVTTLDTNDKKPDFLKEVEVLNSTSATISWQSVKDCVPVLYYFQLLKMKDNSIVKDETTNISSVTLVTLEPGTEYMVKVGTQINGITSNNYLTLKFSTSSVPPDQGIQQLTAYKHTRKEIGLRWKMVKHLLPENQPLKLSYKHDNSEPKYLDIVPQTCAPWPDLYCYTLSNLTARKNYTISITPVLSSKVGVPITIAAVTKETAPGIPSQLTVNSSFLSGLSLKWGIPESLNGNIRSFLINMEEVDKFLEDYCCQDFPVMEIHVTSEKPSYETEIAGLQPASTYAISVSAKTVYFGPPQIMTVNTKPPSMKVLCIPTITVASWLPQDTHDIWKDAPEFHPLITGYMLVAVCVDVNCTDSGISDRKLNSEIVELLGPNMFLAAQYFNDGEAINLMANRDVECKWGEARTSPFTKGHKYKLAAIQVAQYNDAYRLDMVHTPEFVL